jgi:hypothetical protein
MADIIALVRMVATLAGAENAQHLGTHSGKVTMLAAAVLFGIKKEARARLGYHKCAGDRSINSYARELLFEPVQQLTGMIVDIKNGTFNAAAGRVQHVDDLEPEPTQEVELPDEEELDTWHDDEEQHVDTDDELVDTHLEIVKRLTEKCQVDNRVFFHKNSKKIHRGNPTDQYLTACHYFLSEIYMPLASMTQDDTDEKVVLCKRCFGKDERAGRSLMRHLSNPLIDNINEVSLGDYNFESG